MKDAMDKKPKKLKSERMPLWANPESETYQPFFQNHVPEVLEWKIANSLWYKKAQNTGKSPKNDCVTSLRNLQDGFQEHLVVPTFVYSILQGCS